MVDVGRIVEIPIRGMDCAECTRHVRRAIENVPGVESVEVFLTSEKALVRLGTEPIDYRSIQEAVTRAGYSAEPPVARTSSRLSTATRALTVFGLVSGAVLFIVILGEWFGVLEAVASRVPWWVSLIVIATAGYPVFRDVVRATLGGRVISHTLMSLGVVAALVVGEWATAAVVVFFMRVGAFSERFTTDRARGALRDLLALSPQTARIERDGREVEIPVVELGRGDVVIVRPGEKIPVDGRVVSGHAAVDQSPITGEPLPADVGPGSEVYAATLAQAGSLRIATERIGPETTYGRVVAIVQQAESKPSRVQRFADRFTVYFLPLVALVAAATFLIKRDPMATVAVLVVACSCSVALATPIAILASVGAAARQGLLVKGGRTLEVLARVDQLLLDKTGTLTLGQPRVMTVLAIPPFDEETLLQTAAGAERFSEHPLAEAVRRAAFEKGLTLAEPEDFESKPGTGVRATVAGKSVFVGKRPTLNRSFPGDVVHAARRLEERGATLIFLSVDGVPAGFLAAEDTMRPEIPDAIRQLRESGLTAVELLTGDHAGSARELAGRLGIEYRADLLPEDKIRAVQEHQDAGRIVAMVGDGINDAPALKRADVGIAMGVAGSEIALEAADLALMTDNWLLVPAAFQLARRTMRVVHANLFFTAAYNLGGILLAALGLLPPILAAAAQSLPDIGVLANSSRLLRWTVRTG
ncbi:MAG: heavy metal translocating P-type ATPase [Acidobacteriota bacterium]